MPKTKMLRNSFETSSAVFSLVGTWVFLFAGLSFVPFSELLCRHSSPEYPPCLLSSSAKKMRLRFDSLSRHLGKRPQHVKHVMEVMRHRDVPYASLKDRSRPLVNGSSAHSMSAIIKLKKRTPSQHRLSIRTTSPKLPHPNPSRRA